MAFLCEITMDIHPPGVRLERILEMSDKSEPYRKIAFKKGSIVHANMESA